MIVSLEQFEVKIQQVEDYASKYGYTRSGKERVGIRRALEEVQTLEKEIEENPAMSTVSDNVVDSPNLLHMGLSKKTLNSLGFALGKDDKIVKNEMNEKKLFVTSPQSKTKPLEPTVTSDEDDDSYPAPILKKQSTKTKSKLNASAFEHSQVEISPGLFVKRPSSKTKGEKEIKTVPAEETHQSPILPKTDASDKISTSLPPALSIPAISIDQNYGTSPPLPKLESNFLDLQNILTNSKVLNEPIDNNSAKSHLKSSKLQTKSHETAKTNDDCFDSPELPELKTMNLASYLKASSTKISTKESKKDIVEGSVKEENCFNEDKDYNDTSITPELPVLKTVNLANILKPTYSVDYEQNKENKKNDTPELPLLNSQDANLILSSRKTPKSPSKHQPQDDLGDSPTIPELKTINLAAILKEKGTLL